MDDDLPGMMRRPDIVSAAIGLAYVFAGASALIFVKGTLHAPDEFEYLAIGKNLAASGLFSMDGSTPTAWRSPGLPALIAALWWVWPSVYFLKIFNLGCWAATGFFVARLSAKFYGVTAGRLAALVYLFYIYELYAATSLYPQTIAGLLVVISIILVLESKPLIITRQLLLLAISTFQILLIPNSIVVAAVVYPYAILKERISLRAALSSGALILLVIFAWCHRNESAIGGFTFTTTMGNTLYAGNRDSVSAATAGSTAVQGTNGLSELQADKLYRKLAIEWIKNHTWQAIGLYFGKLAYWFSYENTYESKVNVPFIGAFSLGMAAIYYLVLAGSFGPLSSNNKSLREFAILAWIIYVVSAVIYAVFITRIRYRLPFDPLFFALASGALVQVWNVRWRRRNRAPAQRGD